MSIRAAYSGPYPGMEGLIKKRLFTQSFNQNKSSDFSGLKRK